MAAFIVVERRAATPLVRSGIFRKAAMVRADLGAMLFLGAFFGFQFIVTLYPQELRGWSSLRTAIALVVMGCDAVLAIVAYGLLLPVGMNWSYAAMFPSLIIAGTAFALAYGPLTIAATDDVAEEEQGLAGGLLYTFTQFGSAVGISAVTAVYGIASAGGDGSPSAVLAAYRTALVVPVVMVLLGTAVAAVGLRRARTGKDEPSASRPRRSR